MIRIPILVILLITTSTANPTTLHQESYSQISILYHQNGGSRISPKITISKQCTNRYGSCSTINNSPYYFEPFRLMHAFYDFKRLKKKKNYIFSFIHRYENTNPCIFVDVFMRRDKMLNLLCTIFNLCNKTSFSFATS